MAVPRPTNAVPASRWASRPSATPARSTAAPARPSAAPVREDGTPRVAPGVYLLTSAASPQFSKPITVRLIRERTDRHPYCGWTWIEVYQLDARGTAVDRRELYVRPDGLRPVPPSTATGAAARHPTAKAAQ
ncbi:hypothetical protein AB0875_22930 [Micromonospora gifhornensis]|uniref:hypothetical protein n=1 Tax=Micromonospora TaxID=1873 RepID=UPI00256E9C95|nr:hypothetical protein [Verrucosispora sp. FIM060022]